MDEQMTHTISPATDSQKLVNLVGHPVLLNDLDQITEVIVAGSDQS